MCSPEKLLSGDMARYARWRKNASPTSAPILTPSPSPVVQDVTSAIGGRFESAPFPLTYCIMNVIAFSACCACIVKRASHGENKRSETRKRFFPYFRGNRFLCRRKKPMWKLCKSQSRRKAVLLLLAVSCGVVVRFRDVAFFVGLRGAWKKRP